MQPAGKLQWLSHPTVLHRFLYALRDQHTLQGMTVVLAMFKGFSFEMSLAP